MDITRQIYADYCAKTSVKMTNIIQNSFAGVFQTNDSVRIEFSIIKIGLRGEGSVDSDDGTEIISWNDISKIVAEVRKDGKRKKEQKSGFEYLQKE